jgi:hypothetical protein
MSVTVSVMSVIVSVMSMIVLARSVTVSVIRVFKFKSGLGKEQVYHSLDEMPPEKRAIIEKIQGRLDLPGQKPGD